MTEQLERAMKSILVGALADNGRALLLDADPADLVAVNGYGYDDDNYQRITYIAALKRLTESGRFRYAGGDLYELTFDGMQIAKQLVGQGVQQERPIIESEHG